MGMVQSSSATPKGDLTSLFSDDEVDLDNFDLEGFTQEEVIRYNEIAEHGQRLQDALTPKKIAASIRKVPSWLPSPFTKGHEHRANLGAESVRNGHTQPSIAKQMNHYIRKHPFFEKSLATFSTSERRQFERNVYDFARGLGLKKSEARRHVIKAREFCGEEQNDSDSSSYEDEIDDSRSILEALSSLDQSAAVPMAIDLPLRQVDSSDMTPAAPDVPTKVGEDAAFMSAGTKRPSKKRKAKANDMDSAYESAHKLSELANQPAAQQSGSSMNEEKVARRASKKERKRQKRVEIIKDDRIEPEGDTEYLKESAKSQEPGNKRSRKSKKNMKDSAPKELWKSSLRSDEMAADESCGNGNSKSSKPRKTCSRETSSDESSPADPLARALGLLRDFQHPMIQSA